MPHSCFTIDVADGLICIFSACLGLSARKLKFPTMSKYFNFDELVGVIHANNPARHEQAKQCFALYLGCETSHSCRLLLFSVQSSCYPSD